MTTPLYDTYTKGSDNAGISGALISDLSTASVDDDFANKLLPPNPRKDTVPVWDGRNPIWESPPSPDFSAIIDKLAPESKLAEITHTITAEEAGKFIVDNNIYVPSSGELDIHISGGNLVHAFTDDGALWEFGTRAADITSNTITPTRIAEFEQAMDLVAYFKGKLYGILADVPNSEVVLYEVNRIAGSIKRVGSIQNSAGQPMDTTISGMAASDKFLYVLLGINQQLYRIDPVPGAVRGTQIGTQSGSSEEHSGIVHGTMFYSHQYSRLFACANLTGSSQPALVGINTGNGQARQIGGGFAFGNVNTITAMYEHHDPAITDYEILFHLTTGGVYKVALDLSDSNNPTTAVTLRGNLDPENVSWGAAVNAAVSPGNLKTDVPAFRTLPHVAAGDVQNKDNSQFDDSRQYFFGITDRGNLAYGASSAGSELHPMSIYTRTFSGGRRVPTTLAVSQRIPFNPAIPNVNPETALTSVNLDYDGWVAGDRLQFTWNIWYVPEAGLPFGAVRHVFQNTLDTYAIEGAAGDEHYFYFGNSFEFVPRETNPEVFHGVDFADNLWRMKVILDFRTPKILKFHLNDDRDHSNLDAGMHIQRIVRWR